MKIKKNQLFTVLLFCAFLAAMLLGYLFLEKRDFSENEKRYLQSTPALSWESLLSGDFAQEAESFMADHIPGRNFFVGLNSAFELVTGMQLSRDVQLLPGERLVESPVVWDQGAVLRNMQAINSFAEGLGQPARLMIVPSAGWAADKSPLMTLELFSGERYMDAELIADIYAIAGDCIETVDLCPVFQDNEEYYYRTDHHWTSLGAYRACNTYMDALQRPFPAEDEFRVERVDGFQGSTYTRSALWSISAEPLELWHGPSELLVSNSDSDTVQDSLFYRQRLEESDKYTVYLDGNHSIVRIDNPAMAGQGKLLVVRDSYCNVLGGFLAESYESVILVDLRYYKNPVSQLYAELGCDSLLVCYSLSNFMTDSNIVWLR